MDVIQGIDVSHHQGKINWPAVKASGIAFAFARATNGLATDRRFAENWKAMGDVGIPRGAYHFFRFAFDPAAQAEHFCHTVGDFPEGDLSPTVDVEGTTNTTALQGMRPQEKQERLRAFIQKLHNLCNRTPFLYTGPGFWDAHFRTDAFADCPLWVAHYGVRQPRIPIRWPDWAIWQHTSEGNVPGISGRVDMNMAKEVTVDVPDGIVGIAPTPTGRGYWIARADGGVFNLGDAEFFGSAGDKRLNAHIVGIKETPTGKGYWLVAADGGVFNFGDAPFRGAMAGQRLNSPVVGMASTAQGDGYWLIAADGGVFAFGAEFHGGV